jgi:hypothetical protein
MFVLRALRLKEMEANVKRKEEECRKKSESVKKIERDAIDKTDYV